MRALGCRLAKILTAGQVVYLRGELGSGKTTLVSGILRGLGHRGSVTSPTFTLLEIYSPAAFDVCHFDLYRLDDPLELEELGFRDYLDQQAVILIEWPERATPALPPADIDISFRVVDNNRRQVEVQCANATEDNRCSKVLAQE